MQNEIFLLYNFFLHPIKIFLLYEFFIWYFSSDRIWSSIFLYKSQNFTFSG